MSRPKPYPISHPIQKIIVSKQFRKTNRKTPIDSLLKQKLNLKNQINLARQLIEKAYFRNWCSQIKIKSKMHGQKEIKKQFRAFQIATTEVVKINIKKSVNCLFKCLLTNKRKKNKKAI